MSSEAWGLIQAVAALLCCLPPMVSLWVALMAAVRVDEEGEHTGSKGEHTGSKGEHTGSKGEHTGSPLPR